MRIEKHYKKPMNPKGKKFVDLQLDLPRKEGRTPND
jgi:hypothetical protein